MINLYCQVGCIRINLSVKARHVQLYNIAILKVPKMITSKYEWNDIKDN